MVIRQIRQASSAVDFSGKLNLRLNKRFRQTHTAEFPPRHAVFSVSTNRKAKGDRRWLGPWVIIGGFGGKYALVHIRGSYSEVDLAEMRTENRILDVIGCDGTLQLHLTGGKCPLHYFVYSETLISLSEMGNGLSNRNLTTRTNADTRLTPKEFDEPCLNRQISIREMGGAPNLFTDFIGR